MLFGVTRGSDPAGSLSIEISRASIVGEGADVTVSFLANPSTAGIGIAGPVVSSLSSMTAVPSKKALSKSQPPNARVNMAS